MTERVAGPSAPGSLEEFAAAFDPLFGTLAQRRGFQDYVQGHLVPQPSTGVWGPLMIRTLPSRRLAACTGTVRASQRTELSSSGISAMAMLSSGGRLIWCWAVRV